jgi:hypothetical protein
MASDDRLTYCQLSNNHIQERRAFAVSLTATRCGDGECNDFGVFTLTHISNEAASQSPDNVNAAALVARTVATQLMQKFYHITLDDLDEAPAVNEVLSDTVQLANKQVYDNHEDAHIEMLSVVVVDNRLFMTSIGNGCAFVMNDDGLQRLTSNGAAPTKLLGATAKAPDADIVIKYLPPFSGILLSTIDVWDGPTIERVLGESIEPGNVCSELKKVTPPESQDDLVTVMLRLGYLQL